MGLHPEDEQRIVDLEAQVRSMAIRHSALEWIVEQHFSRYLLDLPPVERTAFLGGIISHPGAPAWRKSEEGGSAAPRPDDAAELHRQIEHICQKIGRRVAQGIRQA